MRQLSLTARMSLMFMLAVIAVLTIAGLSFNLLSQYHFKMLDRQVLSEKLQATQQILNTGQGAASFTQQLPQLRALLGAHHELRAIILAGDGRVIFAEPAMLAVPQAFRHSAPQDMWQWQDGEQMFRGMSAKVSMSDSAEPVTITLLLDVPIHAHFFETLQRWFWLGLLISAIASAALGWAVARRGLRPLSEVTQLAGSMSARSLKERIALQPVPLELQQLVSSFNAMLARLDEAFVRLSNFSADIAHELRTPLSNLMTHTEVVLSKKRDINAYEDNLYANLDELKRMSRMIDDMLFLAKADNGLITPEQSRVELAELLDKLFEYYQLLADERGIHLQVSGSGSVMGDRLMLERAISNLLSNALRYTPQGATISANIVQTANTLTLSVANPGEPIKPQHLDKLFDRFYRADPARREGSPSNAGLGLAITRSIIDAHKGKICCTSTQGVTTFHVQFQSTTA